MECFAKFLLRARNVTKYSSFGIFHMLRYSTGGIFCIFLLYKSQKLLPNNPALEYFICLDIPLVEYFAYFFYIRAKNCYQIIQLWNISYVEIFHWWNVYIFLLYQSKNLLEKIHLWNKICYSSYGIFDLK